MTTPITVYGVQSPCVLIAYTYPFSYGVTTGVHIADNSPVNPVAGYTPGGPTFKTVGPVPPMPTGGSSGGGGTVGYAF